MKPLDIWVSFILSLITNMIVLSGSISFIFWLDEQTDGWLARNRTLVATILSSLYLLFLWGNSWLHTYIDVGGYGMHWTFLNMLLVTMFLLNTKLGIWWQVVIESLLVLAYTLLYAQSLTIWVWLCYLGFITTMFISYYQRNHLFKRKLTTYLMLACVAFFGLALITSMGEVPTDGYFWLRQLTALIVLSITGVEYTFALDHMLRRNRRVAKQATIDGLTQLRNFSQFDTDLLDAYEANQIKQTPYAVFELDIDLFKRVNDSFGHPNGKHRSTSRGTRISPVLCQCPLSHQSLSPRWRRIWFNRFCRLCQFRNSRYHC